MPAAAETEPSEYVVPARRPSAVARVMKPCGPWVDTEIWHRYSGLPKKDSRAVSYTHLLA